MIIAPTRFDPLIDEQKAPTDIVAEYLEDVAEDINTLNSDVDTLQTEVAALQADVTALQADVEVLNQIGEDFSATNVIETLSFDADTVTLPELADVVGSIIQKLQ